MKSGTAEGKFVYDNRAVGYTENSSLASQTLTITDNDNQLDILFQISGEEPETGNPDMYIQTVYSGTITMKGSLESEIKPNGKIKAKNYIGVEKGKIDQIKENYLSSRKMTIIIGIDFIPIGITSEITNIYPKPETPCGKKELKGHFTYPDDLSDFLETYNEIGCYGLIDGHPELPAPGGNSDNTTTIIIVVVVVVVVLIAAGVGGFFLWKKFGSKKDEKEASV